MTVEHRTTWPQAAELQQAADRVRSSDPEMADWLEATANALAWLAPYREHEGGYDMWGAASAVARKILTSHPRPDHGRNRPSMTDEQSEVVAYLMGSLWFCPSCARKQDDAENLEPARRSDLMPGYAYRCDQCRKAIA